MTQSRQTSRARRIRASIGTLVLVALVAMLAFAGGASATEPQAVEITVVTHIDGFEDPFEATSAVICAEGTVSNAGGRFIGWQSGAQAQIILVKHFVCPDGTFDVLLRVTLDFESSDTVGSWSVLSGTGAYVALHGAGTLTGDNSGERRSSTSTLARCTSTEHRLGPRDVMAFLPLAVHDAESAVATTAGGCGTGFLNDGRADHALRR